MNTPLSWIKEYVPDLNVSIQEFCDAMTLTGTKAETYTRLDKNLSQIVVGQIKSIKKHPDADKLVVCQVDIGRDAPVQIVTGAPNVEVGIKVPVVLDGGSVAGGHDETKQMPEDGIKIKKGKLRGVESEGMMCSIEELGSSRNYYPEAPENGIYVFDRDVNVGDDAIEALGLHDTVIEYEITSNRVDCYSQIGIAREAAATFGKKFRYEKPKHVEGVDDINDYLSVEVLDEELCPRYVTRMVKNIRLAPSPWWMQRRLAACGIRPINNIVDITNYVMEEYGQPMHAFDYDTIKGKKIVVKRASDGDKFVTLDGQERVLDHDILMICDAEGQIGIAGIMGGENSKITDDIKTMVFESACFDGPNIRLSAKRVGLRTDASGKFEKGVDPNNCMDAVERACELIELLDAGDVIRGSIDIYPKKREESVVAFDADAINGLLGTSIDEKTMLGYLQSVGLRYDADRKEIIAPTFRQDIHCMADLAEEVARFYGYDKIPMTLPSGEATMGGIPRKAKIEGIARECARFLGYSEAMNYSFESPKLYDKLGLSADAVERKSIKIQNPLGEDFSVMRTTTLGGLLQSLGTNYSRRNENVKLFEISNIYIPRQLPISELPDERRQFTLGFYGEGDFFTLKGVVEEFFEAVGMVDRTRYDACCDRPYLHPGRKADIIYKEKCVGYLGQIHPDVAERYGIDSAVYIANIDLVSIDEFVSFDILYEGIARYPAITRDISLVVPSDIMAGDIEDIIEDEKSKLIESYELFDIYEGDQIEKGFKSIAYSIVFRDKQRTLEDSEVATIMNRIISRLQDRGIKLRS